MCLQQFSNRKGQTMAFQKAPLEERIAAIRAELAARMDEHIEAEAKLSPGVPAVVIRRMIENKSGGCLCEQYLARGT